MSCCQDLTGILLNCDRSMGGIKRVFITCKDDISSITIANEEVATITLEEGKEFKEYQFRKETGSVSTAITVDDAAGTLYYESTITLQFTKQETAKRIEIAALALTDSVIVVEDSNSNFWLYGYDFPVTLTDGTIETGTAFADFNGYNITLLDQAKEPPFKLSEAAIATVIGSTEG